jgi:hypothetical protein
LFALGCHIISSFDLRSARARRPSEDADMLFTAAAAVAIALKITV